MSFEKIKHYFTARFPNLVLFLIACSLASFYSWKASDLAWSLWLSNLFVTGAIIASTTAVSSKKEAAFVVIGAGLFVLAILFHIGQTLPIMSTLPYKGIRPQPHEIKEYIASIFISYWPWLPVAFFHNREFILYPVNFTQKKSNAKNPLKSIIFFNLLIYVLILFNKLLHVEGAAACFFVYSFYFFLFDRNFTRSKKR